VGRRQIWFVLVTISTLLLAPTAAQAAGAQVRLLNAAVSGKVTIQIDGKTEFSRVKLGRTTRRHNVRVGRHVITAKLDKRVVASKSVSLRNGQRLTIVYAVKGRRSLIFLFPEPAAARGKIVFRAANFAAVPGTVTLRVGTRAIAKTLRFGGMTAARRFVPASSPTGLVSVSARRGKRTMKSKQPLVLATGSVGLFAVIPHGRRRAQVVRLPYTTPVAAPTHQPLLTGTRRFGHTMRCTGDRWRPSSVSRTRRWTVDGKVVGGGASHALTTAVDAGHTVACTVSATLNRMTTTATVSFKLPGVPTIVTAPSVKAPAGTLAAGQVLTCDHGAWTGAPKTFAYTWFRKSTGAAIGTGRTYTLQLPADNGAVNALGCAVVATNAGGVSAAVRSANTVALGIAPTVTLLTKPADGTTSQDASFSWAVGGGGASTAECKIDAGAFAPCAGPLAQGYQGLATSINGTGHTFTVRVTNPVSSATATYPWKINPVAPTVTLTTVPTNPSQDTSPTFNWTIGGGPSTAPACDLDGNAVPCSATGVTLTNVGTNASGVSHTFTVTVKNATRPNGVSDAATWTLNPLAPTVTLTTVPTNPSQDQSPTFGWTLGGGPSTIAGCDLDGNAVACSGTGVTLANVSTDANGVSHTFKVTVTNVTSPGGVSDSFTWTVNPTAPVLSNLAVNPGSQLVSAPFTLTFDVAGPTQTITCQLDAQPAVTPCNPAGESFADPGLGTHTVTVDASNAGGSANQQQVSFTYGP
jgi:hypothetical protein